MVGKKMLFMMIPVMVFLFSLPVYADNETITSPVIGSWMLDTVFENASGTDRFILDPENAASVYAESENIYTFLAGGTAEMTMEGITSYGSWEKKDDSILMVIDKTAAYSDKGIKAEPDIEPPYEMAYVYDEDQNVLHRYWKDDNPDATYHDLDFIYKMVPQGVWRMTKVYSQNPGQEPVLLDPDTNQSIYAESVNSLILYKNHVENIISSADENFIEKGVLKKSADAWLLKFDDGFETLLYFDDKAGVLHRYWVELATDSPYLNLDFVYEIVPAN